MSPARTPLCFETIELGQKLPTWEPDVSLEQVRRFAYAAGMGIAGRFTDHEQARREGLPGAIVPGVMSQGILAAMIHRWAPGCLVRRLDTVFRDLVLADQRALCHAVVTNLDPDQRQLELDLTIVNEAGVTGVQGTALVTLPAEE